MSTLQAGTGLEAYGIHTSKPVHINLPASVLYEHAIRRGEGLVAADGPLVCRTGAHTGRSPNDKFVGAGALQRGAMSGGARSTGP